MVSERRPDLSRRRCDLLAWSTMAAVMSVSFQRVRLPRTEYDELLADIIETITDVRLPREGAAASEGTRRPEAPGRRAALLAAAARLFAARGYHSVTIDDIGGAVGIAGPSVYRHFPSKLDLMLAMADGAQQMNSDMARILAEQTGEAAVRSLLSAYSTYSLSNGDVIELLITETVHLPEPHRSTYLGLQRLYIDTWLQLLGDLDPSWPTGHARVRLQATFNLINDISRTAHLRVQAITATAVQTMGYALLVPGAANTAGPAEQSLGGVRKEAG
jgi:AcrR family transcriptional regulator